MIPPSSSPVLGLRMQISRCGPPPEFSQGCDHVDRVQAMVGQNSVYNCSDYLARSTSFFPGKESSMCSASCELDANDSMHVAAPAHQEAIDAVCREKMAEWSFRVCDHFHVPREIVAMSFSYLDRFMDKCNCDRSAFKLAAMTTLYMASKINGSSHRVTVGSLAELSRGEFERSHISEMETIILQTLGWRLNPPTAQCFVNSFYNFLPVPQGTVSIAIYQRAMFFAELSLYDYAFVTKPRTSIALAAMINAMEGLNESTISHQQQVDFVNIICSTFGLKISPEEIEAVRNRLWYVYSMSAQYRDDDAGSPDLTKTKAQRKIDGAMAMDLEPSSPSCSPVSVADRRS